MVEELVTTGETPPAAPGPQAEAQAPPPSAEGAQTPPAEDAIATIDLSKHTKEVGRLIGTIKGLQAEVTTLKGGQPAAEGADDKPAPPAGAPVRPAVQPQVDGEADEHGLVLYHGMRVTPAFLAAQEGALRPLTERLDRAERALSERAEADREADRVVAEEELRGAVASAVHEMTGRVFPFVQGEDAPQFEADLTDLAEGRLMRALDGGQEITEAVIEAALRDAATSQRRWMGLATGAQAASNSEYSKTYPTGQVGQPGVPVPEMPDKRTNRAAYDKWLGEMVRRAN
jgi:hypothetical protein